MRSLEEVSCDRRFFCGTDGGTAVIKKEHGDGSESKTVIHRDD
jgi:hypothetical protein